MIYVDVTEGRADTRLPLSVIQESLQVVGLEHWTGADILITTAEGEMPGNILRPPGSLVWQRYVRDGMLIQRKSGNDFLNSIANLHNIIIRMRKTEPHMAWLMIAAEMHPSIDNMTVLDQHPTGWHWNSVQGALDEFQIMGGMVHVEPDDERCADWLLRWDKKLPKLLAGVERLAKEKLIMPTIGALDQNRSRMTLMTLPGIGDDMSRRIIEHCNDRLVDALVWLSDPNASGVKGVGPTTLKRVRSWLALNDNEALMTIVDEPRIHS